MELKRHAVSMEVVVDFTVDRFPHMAATMQSGQCVSTPFFALHPYVFDLAVYPNGLEEADRGSLYVGVVRTDDAEGEVGGEFTVEVLSVDRCVIPGCPFNRSQSALLKPLADSSTYIGQLGDLQRHGLLQEGTLHLRARFFPEFPGLSRQIRSLEEETAASHTKDLQAMLDSALFSDISVVAEGTEFAAHRNILAARSPVLHSMLTSEMTEASRGRVEVPDIDAATMKHFLRFIYSGSFDAGKGDGPDGYSEPNEVLMGRWFFEDMDEGSFEVTKTQTGLAWKGSAGLWSKENPEQGPLHGVLVNTRPGSWTVALANNSSLALSIHDGWLEVKHVQEDESWTSAYARHEKSLASDIRIAESWGKLLRAADKYCVVELAAICEARMQKQMNTCSAATMLRIASETGRLGLKTAILRYITSDEVTLRAVKDMREFDTLDRELALEVMEFFIHPPSTKRKKRQRALGDCPDELEFVDDEDWARLSNAQLRRACSERGLATSGGRK
eukprot:CAMPEP_0170577092 /NCGR_PEP_ID=MMETSP0224-20130122/4739_1 /TAXON_ID=285029 /ORGANISM="Togula jolla, Strain CCCM 725" /LENGTH=501 /DNA_ID=CAMNT_0010899973 /DNA_START=34 /DNA_END=1536 /DNA_ORIENTATION=-